MGLYFENIFADLTVGLALICVVFWVYVKFFVFTYWERRSIKYFEPSFPFGNVGPTVMQKMHIGVCAQELYRRTTEPFIGMFGVTRPTLMVRDPELLRLIFIKNFSHFIDRGVYIDEKHDPLSGHLFSLNGEKWKNLRTKLTPAFTSGKLRAMMTTLLNCGDILQKHVGEAAKSGNVMDVRDVTANFTTDIIASVAFGLETNSFDDPDNEFRHYGRKAFILSLTSALRTFAILVYPKLQKTLRFKSTDADVEHYIMSLVKQTVQHREKNNMIRKDLMQLLIQLRNNNNSIDGDWTTTVVNDDTGKSLSLNEISAQVWIFFAAGFETSSSTISYCLYELAKNADVQQKIHKEIDEISKKYKNQVTYESMSDMKYLEACIDETLRKYPTVPILNRECTKEFHIPGSNICIEKGTAILIPVLGIQNDPKYFPEPDQFRPERFFKENMSDKSFIEMPYMPFGEGPRICIGLRLAKMQTKIGLFMMLKNNQFHFTQTTKQILKFSSKGFVLTPEDGINLKVTAREQNKE